MRAHIIRTKFACAQQCTEYARGYPELRVYIKYTKCAYAHQRKKCARAHLGHKVHVRIKRRKYVDAQQAHELGTCISGTQSARVHVKCTMCTMCAYVYQRT